MSNDILRHKNKSTVDNSVSVASFGDKKVRTTEEKSNSLLSFFRSERIGFNEKLALEDAVPVEKPKLYEPMSLFIELIAISALLIYFCISVNNVFMTVVLMCLSSLIIPVTMVFFFYRLNTRWKMKTSLIVQLASLGVGSSLVLDVVFDKLINYSFNYANWVLPVRNVVDICIVLLIVGFVLKGIKQYSVMSVLLVASIISAGFSASKSMLQLFEVMFVRVQVTNNGITTAVGAIINTPESVKISITALLHNLLNISIFKPTIFISLTVINGFVLRHIFFRKSGEKYPLGTVFLFCFTLIITAFSSIVSSIKFLQVLYTIICVVATGYALYQVVEQSIKQENYI